MQTSQLNDDSSFPVYRKRRSPTKKPGREERNSGTSLHFLQSADMELEGRAILLFDAQFRLQLFHQQFQPHDFVAQFLQLRGASAAGPGRSRRNGPLRHRRLRSEEHTSELQSPCNLVCRLLLEKKKTNKLLTSTPASLT